MKQGIHPSWHNDCVVTCSCGNKFTIGSVMSDLKIDICNKCHPFFTGEMKFVDRQGRVDRFRKKVATAQVKQKTGGSKKASKQSSNADPRSYQEILRDQKAALRKKTAPEEKTEVVTPAS